jgi:TP901 family phage tail tape measure protein
MAGKTLSASIVLNAGGVKKGVDEADAQFGRLGGSATKLSSTIDEKTTSMGTRFSNLGNSLGMFGVPFTGALQAVGAALDEAAAHTQKMQGAAASLHEPMASAEKDMAGAEGSTSKLGGALSAVTGPVAQVGLAVAAGAGVVIASSIDMAQKYQQSTASIASNADISTAAATKIGNAFLTTAGQTTFSAQAIDTAFAGVSGQVKLVNGGTLDAAASMTVMKAAMDLAEGSGTSLNSATSDVTATLQAFGLGVQSSPLVANVLFNAARDTGTSVDSMGNQIDKARAKMGATAPSVQEMGGLLVDLTQHGETGRAAMTTLGSAFTGIVAPTAAVTAAQQAMGVSFINAKGQLDPLDQIIGQVAPKIAGMGNAQAIATLKSIGFGSADSKLLATIQAGPAAYDKAAASVSKTGSAADAAAKQGSTMEGSWSKIKAAVDDARVSLGEKLMPVVTKLAQDLAGFAAGVAKDWPQISEGFKVAWAVAKPIVDSFIERVKGMWNVVSGVVSLIEDIFHGRWGKIWGDLSKIVKGELQNLDGMLLGVPDRLLHLLESLGPKLGGLFTKAFDGVMSAVNSGWSTVANFFTSIPSKVLGLLSSFGSVLGGVATKAWSAFVGAFTGGLGLLSSFFIGIPIKILGWLGDATKWLAKTGLDVLTGLWNGVLGGASWLGGQLLKIGTWVITAEANAVEWLVDTGLKVLNGLWNGILGGASWLDSQLLHIGEWVIHAGDAALSWLASAGDSAIHGLWNGVSGAAGWLAGELGQIAGWFGTVTSDALNWLYNAGGNVVSGLVKGIEDMGQRAVQAIENVGHDLLKGLKSVIPWASPSPLFIDIGGYMMEGLTLGITAGGARATNAMKGVAGALASVPFTSPGTSFAGGTRSAGLIGSPSPGSGAAAPAGGLTINGGLNITVQGSVLTDQQLTDAVYQGLLRKSLVNGSSGQISILPNSGT